MNARCRQREAFCAADGTGIAPARQQSEAYQKLQLYDVTCHSREARVKTGCNRQAGGAEMIVIWPCSSCMMAPFKLSVPARDLPVPVEGVLKAISRSRGGLVIAN